MILFTRLQHFIYRSLVLGLCLVIGGSVALAQPSPDQSASQEQGKDSDEVLLDLQKADIQQIWGEATVWPTDPSIWPGGVFLTSKQSCPIAMGTGRSIPGAIARYGKGRVAVFGHTSYVDPGKLLWTKDAALAARLIRWLANAPDSTSVRILGCQISSNPALVQKQGFTLKTTNRWSDVSFDNPDFDVLVCQTWNIPAELYAKVQQYVYNGGALLTGVTPWVHKSDRFRFDFPSNRLIAPFGIVFTSEGLDNSVAGGFASPLQADPNLNLAWAKKTAQPILDDFVKSNNENVEKSNLAQVRTAFNTLRNALLWDSSFDLTAWLNAANEQSASQPHNLTLNLQISERQPLKEASNPLKSLIAAWQNQATKDQFCVYAGDSRPDSQPAQPTQLISAESIQAFPGTVLASQTRISKSVSIDTNVPDWTSTGLYAPAGETITITVPEAIAKQGGFAVRVGCHKDTLWHLDVWKRYPEISFQTPIKTRVVQVNSAFGGLIYLVVPRGQSLGQQQVQIDGAVEAPLFVLGKTSKEEWERMRQLDTPWGELASSKFIISIPQEVYKTVNDPDALMRYWDRVLDADAEFVSRPKDRERPERMTPDVQISAGYMHSGYPVMTWMDVRHQYVSMKGDWGFYHELGHNHQSRAWTFPSATEVTVNWFTLYCFETIDNRPQDAPGGRMNPDNCARLRKLFEARGANRAAWDSDPFIGLAMFIELKQKYGWDLFKALIDDYNKTPEQEKPRTDEEIIKQMVERMSRITGDDLAPFFKKWGLL